MKIETKFEIHEKVKITELQCNGRVSAFFIDDGGITYRVRYFDKAEVREIYFQKDELEKV